MAAQQKNQGHHNRAHHPGAGLALGIALCIPIGVALFVITGNPGMLGVGAGCGVSIGMAIGLAWNRRPEQERETGT